MAQGTALSAFKLPNFPFISGISDSRPGVHSINHPARVLLFISQIRKLRCKYCAVIKRALCHLAFAKEEKLLGLSPLGDRLPLTRRTCSSAHRR